jgi:hypothetical protein
MIYSEALAVSDYALAGEPVALEPADLELVFRLNPEADRVALAESFNLLYVDRDLRLIVGDDGSGYLVFNRRVYFIPSEADDDLELSSAPL